MRTRNADGFAIIDLVFVCGVISVLALIATPRLLQARQTAGAAGAVGSLRAISSAQLTFALTCGAGFYAPSLRTLGTPPPGSNDAFVPRSLGSADRVNRSGFAIEIAAEPMAGSPASCNGLDMGEAAQGYIAVADMITPQPEGARFFATNVNGRIYEHTSSLYEEMPEVGEPPVGALLK
jgi:type II secretory pathway pseudopilin PulG